MPKLKTHKGTQDRMKMTKTGKIVHGHATTSHFLQKKSAARKRRLAIEKIVTGKSAKNIKRKLGV
jgi:large subunit ribosomal protein L35